MEKYKKYIDSPIGILEIIASTVGILEVNFVEEKKENNSNEVIEQCEKELNEYFWGERKEFEVKTIIEGTEFRKKVWKALTTVPYGETSSYKDIAVKVGSEKAVRAVGSTNKNNKIPIIIPCHRIIGSNGKMVGYDGGIWRKEWLLNHEKKYKS